MADDGLVIGSISDASVELMRRRIGYANPCLRVGVIDRPWHSTASKDAIWQWSVSIGDDNPLYCDPDYAAASRWGGSVAPPGFEMSMGYDRNPEMEPDFAKETSRALRGVQLFHSGGELFYWAPVREGTTLYRSRVVKNVQEKSSEFAGRSVIVTNDLSLWDQQEQVISTGEQWYVHAERRKTTGASKYAKDEAPDYTDEQLAEIEAAYDAEYRRGKDTLFIQDVKIGQILPKMVKGPFTITDMINLHMGGGWLIYGNPPYRLANENRKKLRGFYSRNEFRAWDTIQRVHWDSDLAKRTGIERTYDIGPNRTTMLCNYCTNLAGDDGFVHRIRYEYRRFNYVGDTTWIGGEITDVRVDEALGPLMEISLSGVNQRGQENIRGAATILLACRERGLAKLPPQPPMTTHRR